MNAPTFHDRGAALAVALAATLVLGGCALKAPPGTEELRAQALPNLRAPPVWKAPGAAEGVVQPGWVASFGDPQLPGLIDEALQYNADLAVAAARVEQAAASVRVAGGQIYPAVNLAATTSAKGASSSDPLSGWFLNASWELDVWGRVRYGVRAAEDQYASAQADGEYARQSLAALVTKSWLLAIEARLQGKLAAESVAAAERLVQMSEQRLRVGIANESEAVQARASLETLRDSKAQIDLAYSQALRALEVLLGRYPAAEIEVAAEFPAMPGPVPAGLPSELLERRPDVVAAERRVAAAFDLVGEAKAARLPRISLTAGVNNISSDVVVLQNRDNPAWGVGANLLMPIFQGGALQAQVDLRTAQQKQAVAAYAQVGLRAFNEVESALSAEFTARGRQAILERAAAENQRALALEETRYRIGSSDMRAVTQQNLALYASQMSLLRVRSEQRVQRVNAYLALGGGFGS
jgi:NodT family efflux transporter outer membrane factor (OMF) lipoprotein